MAMTLPTNRAKVSQPGNAGNRKHPARTGGTGALGPVRQDWGPIAMAWAVVGLMLALSLAAPPFGGHASVPFAAARAGDPAAGPAVLAGPLPPSGNDSPLIEAALPRGSVGVGVSPAAVAYDPSNGNTYVADSGSDNVTVLEGNRAIASVAVGANPEALLVLPNGGVLASCLGTDSITEIDNTTVAGTFGNASTLDGPLGMAYDPTNQYVYVANAYALAGTVAMFGTTGHYYGTLLVGGYPHDVAYDPADGEIYVTNAANTSNRGNSVSVIRGSGVLTNITNSAFDNPAGIAYDPADGNLYVTNAYFDLPSVGSVTVLNGTSVLRTTYVGGSPRAVAYDPLNQWMYVVDGSSGNLSVFNGTTFLGSFPLGADAISLGFGPLAGGSPGASDLMVPLWPTARLALFATGWTLSVGPTTAWLGGTPTVLGEVGLPMTFNTTLNDSGLAPDVDLALSVPGEVLGCPSTPQSAPGSSGLELRLNCTPTAAGQFVLWENITDSLGATVSSWLAVSIFHALRPLALNALTSRGTPPTGNVPFGASLAFEGNTSQGKANYTYHWTFGGIAANACAELGAFAACTFTLAGHATINLTVTDALGASVRNGTTIEVSANSTSPAPPTSRSGGAPSFVLVDLVLGLVVGLAAGAGVGAVAMRGRSRAAPPAGGPPPPEA